MDEGYDQICYTVTCENFVTIALKIPLGSKIYSMVAGRLVVPSDKTTG